MQDTKIITPNANSKPVAIPPLNEAGVISMQQMLARLTELNTPGRVVQPKDDEEKVGVTQALVTLMLTHATSLLNCWLIVEREYKPLTQGMAFMLRRAGLIQSGQK